MFRTSQLVRFLVAVIVLAACASSASVKVYTDSICDPPCWRQIIPGQSDGDQVRTILRDLSFVNQTSVHNEDGPEPPDKFEYYRVLIGGGELFVELRNDKVVSIYIRRDGHETLANVLDRFGPPESVYAEYDVPADEPTDYYIYLYYPSMGALFTITDQPQSSVFTGEDRIAPDMLITQAGFVEPGTIRSILADLGANEDSIQCILNNVQPWKGYGSISVNPDVC